MRAKARRNAVDLLAGENRRPVERDPAAVQAMLADRRIGDLMGADR